MKYTQLPQTYRDDVLAEAIYSREVEFFHYDFDRSNFTELLQDMPLGSYRTNIEERLAGTIEQMGNVERIYNALLAQVTDVEAHAAAVLRTTKKRENQGE
jgi:2-polyprenyl-6-methoxyphenol hydroxylase-like FAD-dependent oxidoreductase